MIQELTCSRLVILFPPNRKHKMDRTLLRSPTVAEDNQPATKKRKANPVVFGLKSDESKSVQMPPDPKEVILETTETYIQQHQQQRQSNDAMETETAEVELEPETDINSLQTHNRELQQKIKELEQRCLLREQSEKQSYNEQKELEKKLNEAEANSKKKKKLNLQWH